MFAHLQASDFVNGDAHPAADAAGAFRAPVKDLLFKEMENILVERRIRSEPPLQPLWEAAVRRRREAAAALVQADEVDLSEARSGSPTNVNPGAPVARSSQPAAPVDYAVFPDSMEPIAHDVKDPPAQSSSTETVVADEGPRQRTTSTRSYIRVIGRASSESTNVRSAQIDDVKDI